MNAAQPGKNDDAREAGGCDPLLDMVLSDDSKIDWCAEEFMKGNFAFSRNPE